MVGSRVSGAASRESAGYRRQSLCEQWESVIPEGYRHPAFDERCRIYALRKSGLSNGAVTRHPGRHPATISREIRRDGGGRGYRRGQARRKATERRSGASSVPGKLTEERRERVVAKPGRALMSLRLSSPCSADRHRPFPAPGDPPGHGRPHSSFHIGTSPCRRAADRCRRG